MSVTAGAGCAWTAVSNNSFITITSGSSGSGNGTVNYSVAGNSSTSQRTGTVTIAGKTFNVTQSGTSCNYSISPTSQSFGSSGGSNNVSVTAGSGCAWTAVSNNSFITITSGSSGSGNGTVSYSVSSNSSTSQRTGTMTIAGQTFNVTQSGISCSYSLSPTSQSFGSVGGSNNVSITAGSGCAWTAVSNSSFINITAGSSGSGNGTVSYSVSSNSSTSQRTGTMTIAGQTFTVTQSGTSCSYSISPTSQSFSSSGGSSSVGVNTSSGCAWTAVSNDSFITITSGSSGSGNGTVNYSVAANSSTSQRTGTMTIAGQTFTVTQSAGGGCPSTTISLDQTINGTLTTSDCIFSGTTRYVDVYNFSGTTGQQIVVAMNSSVFDTYLYLLDSSNQLIAQDDDGGGGTNSRIPTASGFFNLPATGTYTVYATSYSADGTTGSTGAYAITLMSANCSYALSPTSQSFASSGGNGSFSVSTSSGCAWAAVSNASWITTTSSGSGNGSVNYVVASNTGAARTGTITVNGQTHTVNQDGVSPNVLVTVQTSPSGRSFSVDGTTYTSAQTFSWQPSSSHSISTTSPQGNSQTRYNWNNWNDGGAISHNVSPSSSTTYTANFTTQHYLTMNAGTGGTVIPQSGWYNSGQSVQITSNPNSGFSFSSWAGSGSGSFTGTSNPANVTMNGPITETASFTSTPGNVQVTVQTNPSSRSYTVDGSTFTSTQTFTWTSGSSHTISTTSPQSGASGTRYVWSNWSDGGAISHTVSPTSNTTYTANFTTQYFLTMNAGAGGTVSPSSNWFNSGQGVSISAAATSGFSFSGWTGSGSGSFTGSTNPANVTMNGPITETANFSTTPLGTNVALSANGGVASASSTLDSGRAPSAVNNGDRKGLHWGSNPATGSGWHDATSNTHPDWVQIDFSGQQTINRIDVVTIQDNFQNPIEPNSGMTFSSYGITAFDAQYWNGASWVTVPGGNVTGNNKVWRQFDSLDIQTSKIRVLVNSALASYSRIVELEAWGTGSGVCRRNVALATSGANATASSTLDSGRSPLAAINGDRKGQHWGTDPSTGSGWHDASSNTYPDWLQIDFSGSKTINEIDVYTIQDNYGSPAEPSDAMTFAAYGITAFDVQYWNGSSWVTVSGGSVTGNNKVKRTFTFAAISTNKVRVLVNGALASYSRIVEVEAWEPACGNPNVALASNGGVASASSTLDGGRAPSATNNGDRKGQHWGTDPSMGSGWHDATQNSYPDWLQIDFNGSKTISEIDVFTVQDNYSNPLEPTDTMTFGLYGITAFEVQYWTGSAWITVPGGSVIGNDKVKRTFTFSPIATTKIRVLVNNALAGYGRITEVEAYQAP